MALCSESQSLDATRPITVVSTRTTTMIGTWNVRTMDESGKTLQVAREMRRYNLSILGISECRWIGSGQFRLSTGELLLYSGHTDEEVAHTGSCTNVVATSSGSTYWIGSPWSKDHCSLLQNR